MDETASQVVAKRSTLLGECRLSVICCFLIVAGLIVTSVWLATQFDLPSNGPLNEKNFAKIKDNMTLSEVESVLGKSHMHHRVGISDNVVEHTWIGGPSEPTIQITFTDGKVVVRGFSPPW